jgi:L-cysteine/cystine lyase
MTFEEARAAFPALTRLAYLNAGTFGPLSRATSAAMDEQLRRDADFGRAGLAYRERMIELRADVRGRIGALLGVAPEHVALTASTTDGCNVVLGGLDLGPEDEVVTTDAEHPGLLAPLHATGARVVPAPTTGRPAADALDIVLGCVTARTRLLALSHVCWSTGQVFPVHELKAQTGLPVLVDGAQSVGAIPVGVGELDFYTVSGQKWLCGPDATGALYVRRPESLRIARPSYFSQAAIEPDGTFEPRAGAERFDTGWTAVPSLAGFAAALDGAPEWRFEHAAAQAAHCRELLEDAGFELITEPGQATLVTFVPRGDAAETTARLSEAGVVVRDLPAKGWSRVSCGYWTSGDDLDRLVAALA